MTCESVHTIFSVEKYSREKSFLNENRASHNARHISVRLETNQWPRALGAVVLEKKE